MKSLKIIAWVLLIIGGINWGIVGLFPDYDLGNIIGQGLARVVYILVGISTIIVLSHKKRCNKCSVDHVGSPSTHGQ